MLIYEIFTKSLQQQVHASGNKSTTSGDRAMLTFKYTLPVCNKSLCHQNILTLKTSWFIILMTKVTSNTEV